jgi:hypothetical protein
LSASLEQIDAMSLSIREILTGVLYHLVGSKSTQVGNDWLKLVILISDGLM